MKDSNNSGIVPCEFKVLIDPDESDVLAAYRRAGLQTPDDVNERYRAASMTGTIVAVAPAAFSYFEWPPNGDDDLDVRLPKVGDRVVFGRYAGLKVMGKSYKNAHGRDEQDEYRLVNDKDIAAILEFKQPGAEGDGQ